jgi:putative transposase
MQDWLKAQEIKTLYIKPDPWKAGILRAFMTSRADECLNRELFGNLHEARLSWRAGVSKYNERRPRSALGYRTPTSMPEKDEPV